MLCDHSVSRVEVPVDMGDKRVSDEQKGDVISIVAWRWDCTLDFRSQHRSVVTLRAA